MAIIVSILGVVAVAIGLMAVAQPKRLVELVNHWRGPKRFWLAIVLRIIIGAVLLLVAPACSYPTLVSALGVIAIVAALIIWIAGQRRLDSVIDWWLGRPELIRASALFAIAFGILMVYAGA